MLEDIWIISEGIWDIIDVICVFIIEEEEVETIGQGDMHTDTETMLTDIDITLIDIKITQCDIKKLPLGIKDSV